ncbi:uncharacterized protein RJT21DRAFT_1316 [Scheffersomyces amazonensis]|uniref:uncharacterized protein n=1 Tax=Scheffersomyces amazonensis TaxID=1078765 RepID=UPI00315C93A0
MPEPPAPNSNSSATNGAPVNEPPHASSSANTSTDHLESHNSSFQHKPQVSNLTKNLLSAASSSSNIVIPNATTPQYDQYSSSKVPTDDHHSANNSFQPINYIPSSHNTPTVISSSYSSNHSYTPSIPSTNNFISAQPQTLPQPSSSSYKPQNVVPHAIPTTNISMDSANSVSNHNSFVSASSSFNPPSFDPTQGNSYSSHSVSIPHHHQPPPQQYQYQSQQQRFPNSFPVNGSGFGNSLQQQPQPSPHQNQFLNRPQFNNRSLSGSNTSTMSNTPTQAHESMYSAKQQAPPSQQPQQPQQQQQQQQKSYNPPEPDHYMSYSEFFSSLLQESTQQQQQQQLNEGEGGATAAPYEEHLNIAEFPVNDLIVMLSCLLTKIIEANDKLHPNHFNNTIAIRQQLKEEKKQKKLQKIEAKKAKRKARRLLKQKQQQQQQHSHHNQYHQSGGVRSPLRSNDEDGRHRVDVDVINVDDDDDDNIVIDHDGDGDVEIDHDQVIDVDAEEYDEDIDDDDDDDDIDDDDDDDVDDDLDDEEDEMKNKYLANVLAFHGTNIPGISLHAYLARVLKYCPVTNDVFLSLLVYFDRIAKKANNLNQHKSNNNNNKNGLNSSSAINNEINSGDNSGSGTSDIEQLFVMDSYNIHRLIISGITVSSKFFSDIFYKNLRYAKVGGLPLEELNYLELQFLLLLDFKLMISVEDLQNYGDLLLRFWKREQLANELVTNHNEEDVKKEA